MKVSMTKRWLVLGSRFDQRDKIAYVFQLAYL